ncbi:sensor histidine kinase [Marinobacterium litorale]|uniref:sensor histidine kinase n=1 Tax=Marinobacterium litorale TaxID=404770 RepID=UPI0003F7063F|nr:sensor histidine kinase [Marinobacterium litorale]
MTAVPGSQVSSGSLEQRIRHRLLMVLLVVFGGLAVLLDLAIENLTGDFVQSRLQIDAESLIAALEQTGPDGQWQVDEQHLPGAYQRPRSGYYYQLSYNGADLSGEIRSRSLWDLEVNTRQLDPGVTQTQVMSAIEGQRWLVRQLGFVRRDTAFSLWIAQDVAPLDSARRRFELYLLGIVLVTIAVLLFWQRLILHRGFAALEPLRAALRDQALGGESELPSRVPQEVQPLVDAIQMRLQRSGEQTKRSRTALGNLAHELKRPLQQLRWLAGKCPDAEGRVEMEQIYEQLSQRIERELRRARIAGAPAPGQQFVPTEEVPHLEKLLALSAPGSLRLHKQLPEGAMPYDRDDMIELLGNLLDNAWRFAREQVWLSITAVPDGWRITVADDGPGVPDQLLSSLSQRGLRVDESQGDGQGLGLSICQSVVESYDGTINFEHSRHGGLAVVIDMSA